MYIDFVIGFVEKLKANGVNVSAFFRTCNKVSPATLYRIDKGDQSVAPATVTYVRRKYEQFTAKLAAEFGTPLPRTRNVSA